MAPVQMRERVPWFNVPPSQQPLRVRDTRRPPAEPESDQPDCWLHQLAVVPVGPGQITGLHDQDRQEIRDAAHECEHDRLPGDRSAPCGCWPQETLSTTLPTIAPKSAEWQPSARAAAIALAVEQAKPKAEAPYYRFLRELGTPPLAWPEPTYPDPVPDLIPDWVLADARDWLATGMSYRKIARAVLTVTDCESVPECEQLLKLRLQATSSIVQKRGNA